MNLSDLDIILFLLFGYYSSKLFREGVSKDVLSAPCDRAMWLFRRLLPGRQRLSF